jgi:hypothetical protein
MKKKVIKCNRIDNKIEAFLRVAVWELLQENAIKILKPKAVDRMLVHIGKIAKTEKWDLT